MQTEKTSLRPSLAETPEVVIGRWIEFSNANTLIRDVSTRGKDTMQSAAVFDIVSSLSAKTEAMMNEHMMNAVNGHSGMRLWQSGIPLYEIGMATHLGFKFQQYADSLITDVGTGLRELLKEPIPSPGQRPRMSVASTLIALKTLRVLEDRDLASPRWDLIRDLIPQPDVVAYDLGKDSHEEEFAIALARAQESGTRTSVGLSLSE